MADTDSSKDYMHFLAFMGAALTGWANVEDAHFLVFKKMMGETKKEISSVIYFSPPSFESRRVLVDRVSNYYLADEYKKEWAKLDKELQTASSQRGQLAHYGLDFELLSRRENEDGSLSLEFGKPRLRPSSFNEVHVLQGKTGEKHILTAEKIANYADSLRDLELRIRDFVLRMQPASPPEVDFPSALLPDKGLLAGLRQYIPNSSPSGEPPSEK